MDASPHRFRLERIRSLRERSEDHAKQALAEAQHAQHDAEEQLRVAADRMISARESLSRPVSGMDVAAQMLARHGYLERTERMYTIAKDALEQRGHETDVRRDELVSASRAKRSLDRLAERSAARHQLEAGRREAAALDEMALNGHRRRFAV